MLDRMSVSIRRSDRPSARTRRILVRALIMVVVLIIGLCSAIGSTVRVAGAVEGCSGETRDGTIRVVVVVDFGTQPGAPTTQTATCAVLAKGSTGGDLLEARAAILRSQKPRYNGSGLMCALDGFPSTGCGQMTPDGYLYWAYWTGTSGSWVYGGGNPFTRRLSDGDIEGWRFTLGSAGPQDPAPRTSPDRDRLFPTVVSPTTMPAPVGGQSPGPGGSVSDVPRRPDDAPRDPAGQPPAESPVESPVESSVDGAGSTVGPSASGDPGASSDDDGRADATSDDDSAGTTVGDELAARPSVVEGAMSIDDRSTGSSPVGVVLGSCAVVGLGIAAFLRFRRRPDASQR